MSCRVSDERLQRWLDGELPPDAAAAVAAELVWCEHCGARAEAWRRAARELNRLVDSAVGEVNPLLAVSAIHERLAAERQGSWMRRLGTRAADGWLVRRRALVGAAIAAGLGALAGPALLFGLDRAPGEPAGPVMASVVVESLEFDGQSRAVIYRPARDTTIIWVESEDSAHVEEF